MKVVSKVILALAVAVFIFSGWKIYSIYQEYQKGIDEYQGISSYVRQLESSKNTTSTDHVGNEKEIILSIDFKSLEKINPDIIAWIYMPSTGISYPVTQCGDNETYLHRTFEGQTNGNGCIFADSQASSDFTDFNTFLYGHNMKNGTMFGSLKKLIRDDGLYDENPFFYIYTQDFIYKYKIYAYYVTPPDSDSYDSVLTKEEYKKYLSRVISKSAFNCDVNPDSSQNTVTLSTCSGSGETKQRFLVHGILVETRNQ